MDVEKNLRCAVVLDRFMLWHPEGKRHSAKMKLSRLVEHGHIWLDKEGWDLHAWDSTRPQTIEVTLAAQKNRLPLAIVVAGLLIGLGEAAWTIKWFIEGMGL